MNEKVVGYTLFRLFMSFNMFMHGKRHDAPASGYEAARFGEPHRVTLT